MGNKYSELVGKFLTMGAPDIAASEWIDYSQMGIGSEHIPELITMLRDDELNWGDPDSLDVWAPLHAWRALGQMKAVEAIDALLDQLHLIDDIDDDWIDDEFPKVFSKIGAPAVVPLAGYIGNNEKPLFARICAMHSLEKIGKTEPSIRDRIVEILAAYLRNHENQDSTLNAFLILHLTELNAVESLNEIRRAYFSDNVDLDVMGDIEDAEIYLGLRPERQSPFEDIDYPYDLFDSGNDFSEISDEAPFIDYNCKPGRNEPCPCGSGKKYKKCCLK